MRVTVVCLILTILLGPSAVRGAAQPVPRDDYYRYVPPMPGLVSQTAASERMGLYGDGSLGSYRDVAPADGIDDTRARQLLRIATRFSPILRRNNFSVPRLFARAFGGPLVIHVDTWRGGRRLAADSIVLGEPAAPADDGFVDSWSAELARSDAVLTKLLGAHDPRRGAPRVTPAEGADETIMYLDFPGEDPKSWRKAYGDARDHGTYAHFFVHEDATVAAAARFTLVVQYWFFYPFNDSGNNHEGDWEHLAVLLTTGARMRAAGAASGLLTEVDVRRILDDPAMIDSLAIREVEYYFHEKVVTVPYLPQPEPPHSRLQELTHLHVWEQADYIENATRERLAYLGGQLATHPIGYIGGNNKGPDELTNLVPRFQASYNRNGHGTYPFSGTWQGVGPLGATEQMSGRVVPRIRKSVDLDDPSVPLEALFEDDHFIAFEASEIVLVPDWERVVDLVLTHPDARRNWSWLLLPLRWGYPASVSPGAGAIAHVDIGHVAPEGPAYQPTWNRLAAESGFHAYQPRVLRSLFAPMTPWDRLSNGWGFLNIPKTLLGFVPGWSVVLAQLGPWLTAPLEAVGAPPSKVFAPESRPYRFSSVGIGWHAQFGGRDFARMLPEPHDAALARAVSEGAPAEVEHASRARIDAGGVRAWLNLHYGKTFSVQNTIGRSTSTIRYALRDAAANDLGAVEGTLKMTEVTGGFRYRVTGAFDDVAVLFAGAGWGWTWYDVEGVRFRGDSFDYSRTGGYPVTALPSTRWWPNTWYGGIGVELLAPQRGWVGDRIGYGLQVEYTGLLHRLGATRPGRAGSLGSVARREVAAALVISW